MKRGILSFAERVGLAWEGFTLTMADLWQQAAPMRAAMAAQARRTAEHPLSWGSLYVGLFLALSLSVLDRPVAWFFKHRMGGELEGFFKTVTRLGEAEWYLVPAGILGVALMLASLRAPSIMARDRLRRLAVAPLYLFASIAVSGIISNIIKFSLGRMRPRYLFEQGLYGFEPFNHSWAMNSFPSGHSQAGFAAMTALAVLFPRHVALWMVVAVLVAFSRVATTVHYLSDAVAGSWLAIVVAILLARFLRSKGLLASH